MTSMVPAAQTLSKQQHLHISGDYAGCGTGANYREDFDLMSGTVEGYAYFSTESCLGSDPVVGDQNMAEDESRTNSSLNEAATSSKDLIHQEERDEGWLKLSIGGHAACSHNSKHDDHQANPTARRGSGSIELDLLPGGSTSQQARPLAPIFHVPEFRVPRATSFSTSLFFQHPGSSTSNFPHHQEINWAAFRPIRHNIGSTASSSTSSSSSLMPFGSYFAQPPLQLQSMMDVAGPSLDFRVIDPPRRPHSGIWFMLRASQNQTKEPFLPQIPKNYLRIKDGRMTVRLLMKYLVNKLKLDSESEIQITCRGQELQPFLTLQHVRDNIWQSINSSPQRPPEAVLTLLPPGDSSSSTTDDDHVMVLYYGRSAA
ncbi:hypothetical protein I3760_06G109100 [Carya illinoinensis]|uniref:Protein LAX PANICLE 2-like n=1 Tax=Carya illinoinensis TaxID=32201 RepID=A0A8T1QAG3_CARIL|nr:uncharacterized protein LOC122313909 isoform X1 [Carya illinoinensis]KAG2702821.1 hypothetical protein I3760_06G109100 [Carya illinoinensis]KAG6651399.1 hypothetical protein CIPAW_06G108000 [Carya illinoinensis]